MKRPPRILLAYGYAPSGHSGAAFALAEACRREGMDVSLVEIAGTHHPWAAAAVARGYHGLLGALPGAWGALYASARARAALRAIRTAYLSLGGAGRLRAAAAHAGADLVVCPQAAVAAVLAEARRRGELEVPVAGVLTDWGVHPFWADPPADVVFAPDEASARALEALGVPRGRVHAAGIPVHPAFAERPARGEARRALALPAAAPVALLSGGGKGLGGLEQACGELLRLSPRAVLLVLCGRNGRLRAALLERPEAGERLRVFGPQPPAFVARLMAAADIHVGKPGGMSAAESAACGLPLVLLPGVPGQEEGNAARLTDAGAASSASDPSSAARLAADLLATPARLARLRAGAAAFGRPDAASVIARRICDRTPTRWLPAPAL